MNSKKTRCRWCNNLYSSAGAYGNHIRKSHPEHHQAEDFIRDNPPVLRRTQHRAPAISATHDTHDSFKENITPGEVRFDPGDISPELCSPDIGEKSEKEDDSAIDQHHDSATDHESEKDDGLEIEQDSDIEPISTTCERETTDASEYQIHRIHQFPLIHKAGEAIREFPFCDQRSVNFNHLYPFENSRDYKLARFFVASKVPKSRINDFFNDEILPPCNTDGPTSQISFGSAHTLYKQISKMVEDPPWYSGHVEFPLRPKSEFRYRNIIKCIEYLLRQKAFVNNMMWAPIKIYNHNNDRIYSEMNTGSWWWEQQVCHSCGIIFWILILLLVYAPRRKYTNSSLARLRSNPPHQFFRR